MSAIVISTGGSSSRSRTWATTQPTARPSAAPPMPEYRNSAPASNALNVPVRTAATATL